LSNHWLLVLVAAIALLVVAIPVASQAAEPIAGGTCRVHTYTAGQVFLEHPNNEYNAVNTGSEPYVIAATFFNVPHGGPSRIDQADPGNC
jgi:hypothetical protein